ncbi:ribonuclease E activity regulator RraA [Deinococcus ruber]|uniref:4-hydroxy-4-methyl-2-oxoglutarate aldolase n=1 Tax=Deinococcus ruber TaxID=1848197 RepID=A0A918F5C0_9DEIO|nr:ribonuclease E activity regulator RraA [Deinococcus ruber]GGR02332.1 putative 4-hydroxy-4-methyl-2-oxoglutarate aldolase [Deinococcus ruber]
MSASDASPATADLSDAHPDVQIADAVFRDFGGRQAFFGQVVTVRAFEDNSLVRQTLETPGLGQVLVVDGGASLNCALLGGNMADLAVGNGWAGVVINGCVRDTAELSSKPVGIRALAAHPRRSAKRGEGEKGVSLMVASVSIEPGDWLYADADGLLVSREALHPVGSQD